MTFEGQYLTYAEYQSLGGSAIGEMPFNLLEFQARQIVDKYTFARLKDLEEQNQDVKVCIFELVNMINSDTTNTQNKAIASESIDGYRVSYLGTTTDVVVAKNKEIEGIVRKYLIDCKLEDGTPYMYRGRC